MKKLFIIILDPNIDTSVVKSRITELGDYYVVYDNQYFVLTDYDNAQSVYRRLICNEENPVGIVILCIEANALTYWGYSDKRLWEWLRSHNIQ